MFSMPSPFGGGGNNKPTPSPTLLGAGARSSGSFSNSSFLLLVVLINLSFAFVYLWSRPQVTAAILDRIIRAGINPPWMLALRSYVVVPQSDEGDGQDEVEKGLLSGSSKAKGGGARGNNVQQPKENVEVPGRKNNKRLRRLQRQSLTPEEYARLIVADAAAENQVNEQTLPLLPSDNTPENPPEPTPTVTATVLDQLVAAETRLKKYRALRKDGVDEKQARLQSGFKDEPEDEEEYLWTEVQDTETGQTYYWNNDAEVTSTKPVKNVWRIVMVFKPTSDGNEKPASVANEFEFGNGTWVNRGRTNMPPKLPKASSKTIDSKGPMIGKESSRKTSSNAPSAAAGAAAAQKKKTGVWGKSSTTAPTTKSNKEVLPTRSESTPRDGPSSKSSISSNKSTSSTSSASSFEKRGSRSLPRSLTKSSGTSSTPSTSSKAGGSAKTAEITGKEEAKAGGSGSRQRPPLPARKPSLNDGRTAAEKKVAKQKKEFAAREADAAAEALKAQSRAVLASDTATAAEEEPTQKEATEGSTSPLMEGTF